MQDRTGIPLKSVLTPSSHHLKPIATGRAGGVAVVSCFESVAAHMAEVSVGEMGKITVHKMFCAADCGAAICPDAIRAQAEGGIIMGLSTAFHEKVSFANGGVKTANHDSHPVLAMSEVPEIEVSIPQTEQPYVFCHHPGDLSGNPAQRSYMATGWI